MEIIRAKTAGFCMGVSLALRRLDKIIAERDEHQKYRIVTFGPIIHNPQVLKCYEQQGVICTENLDEIQVQDRVIIRAHGLPKNVEAALRDKGAIIIDATCPKVKQAQIYISEATSLKQTLLLFGESEHPEVKGLISYAQGQWLIFDSLAELKNKFTLKPGVDYVLAAQTTQDMHEFQQIGLWLQELISKINILQTICDATKKRQDEVLEIARHVEAMIIVGGRSSGNTRRLAMLSAQEGVNTQHVETADELELESLQGKSGIGLSGGASTPTQLIDQVHTVLERI